MPNATNPLNPTRRQFLGRTLGIAGAGAALVRPLLGHVAARAAQQDLGGNDHFKILKCFEIRHTLGQHPGVTRLANGDLLVTYSDYTDCMEGCVGYVLRSGDQGRTWSDPILTLKTRKEQGGVNISMGMQTLGSGRVLIPWYDGVNRKKYKNKFRADFGCLRSDDNGETWEGFEPQSMEGLWNPLPYGKIVELPDGEVFCPVWSHRSATEPYSHAIAAVLRSKDKGATFYAFNKISETSNETDVTLLADGRLLALLRGGFGDRGLYTYYAHSSDGGTTWSEPKSIGFFAQNFNAWYTAKGTLVAACRGIDGSGRIIAGRLPLAERQRLHEENLRLKRQTPQIGWGIHFFRATKEDGSAWEYLFNLPDPKGWQYVSHGESGEPCFCNLPNGDLLVVYYSYDESIYDTLDFDNMPAHTRSESNRIPHCFKRRPCACILREV